MQDLFMSMYMILGHDKLFMLMVMIFCHIVDDYYLQGWLASAKQKSWWKQNAPDKLYEHDYVMALFMHSFSWTFMIMLFPTLVYYKWSISLFIVNLFIHMIVDDMKANQKRINLIQDQLTHIVQILLTWYLMVVI